MQIINPFNIALNWIKVPLLFFFPWEKGTFNSQPARRHKKTGKVEYKSFGNSSKWTDVHWSCAREFIPKESGK